MQKVFVKLNSAEQVKNFVNVIDRVEANFELGSGRRIVDPKSILSVYTLDLTQPQELRCDSEDTKVMERLAPFIMI